jgi:L-ribulose-5-phosphate 4-epimerase
MMSKFRELKKETYDANIELVKKGLVIHTFGNVSVADRSSGVIAIKPSGVDYEILTPEDIVIVDLENNIVEGDLRPSSDTKTHTLLYRNFKNIGSVVHTHSTYAVAWAQAVKSIPVLGTTHADHLPFDIPVTEIMSDEMIKGDYEEETGHQIINAFKELSYEEIEMVLVACHGPFTWGATAEKAVHNAFILEELAKMALHTLQINPAADRLKESLIDKHYRRKHGKDSYYGQD